MQNRTLKLQILICCFMFQKNHYLEIKIENYYQLVNNIHLDLILLQEHMDKINLVLKLEIRILIMTQLQMIRDYQNDIQWNLIKNQLSSSLTIPIDSIEILGVSKGSLETSFQITGNNQNEIQQQIKNTPEAQKFLNTYYNGKIEYVAYFDQARNGKGLTLSSDDFNPQYNMSLEGYPKKEQRGPPYHRYSYYFPRGCYGFGLNVKKYGNDQEWIQKNGNPNEWRIMYHGTHQECVSSIVKNNLKPGLCNAYNNDDCLDEFGNSVKVGNGIFSDRISTCIGYASYTQVGDKQFAVIFRSQVNPKKIRQSQEKKGYHFFLVNQSKDVRLYRILLHEKK